MDAINLYSHAKFLPAGGFKWIDPKEFTKKWFTKNSSKIFVQKGEYSKELREWHNDHQFAPNQTEIKKRMSKYSLTFVEFFNIAIGNVKKFDKEKYLLH